ARKASAAASRLRSASTMDLAPIVSRGLADAPSSVPRQGPRRELDPDQDNRTMPAGPLHSWELDPVEARALQKVLAERVDVTTPLGPYELVAAADASYDRGDVWLCAAIVVTRLPTFEVVARSGLVVPLTFPYVPGLLSFREAPGLVAAF